MHSSVHRIHARRSTSIGGVDAAASRPANQLINFTNHITAMQVNEKPDNQVNQPSQQSMTSIQIKSPKLRTRKALIPRTKIPRPRPRALAHPPQPKPDKRSRRKVNRPSHSPPEIPAPGAISPATDPRSISASGLCYFRNRGARTGKLHRCPSCQCHFTSTDLSTGSPRQCMSHRHTKRAYVVFVPPTPHAVPCPMPLVTANAHRPLEIEGSQDQKRLPISRLENTH